MFPYTRLRRTRKYSWIRNMIAETNISTSDLVQPIFIIDGENLEQEIDSLPGIKRFSIDRLDNYLNTVIEHGINAIAIFPSIEDSLKSDDASESFNQDNLVCRAIRHIKNKFANLGIICDVALDPYTTHGHDGIMKDGFIDNDLSIEVLKNQALCLAKAGADIVAPSDMMDGRICAIREIFEENNFTDIIIMSYAAKYASAFYSPFRDALQSKNNLGAKDKKTYQMDYRNSKEATREVREDIEEGADAVIIKPGTLYLDIVNTISSTFDIPVFAYHVSGEYAMLKFAAQEGALNFEDALLETITAFKRAGASSIITYGAIEIAKIINKR